MITSHMTHVISDVTLLSGPMLGNTKKKKKKGMAEVMAWLMMPDRLV